MLNIDQKIKIKDDVYIISHSFLDMDTKEEVIILRKKQKVGLPTTIYDFGYKSINEIVYNDSDILDASQELDGNINNTVEIAIIDPSGLVTIKEVILRGRLILKDIYLIEFEGSLQKISLDFLINSFLFAKEFRNIKEIIIEDIQKDPYYSCLGGIND
jgi:hypothetical protein